MKQKLALCCALIDRPQLCCSIEPTTGVDPVSRRDFWDVAHHPGGRRGSRSWWPPLIWWRAERCHRIALGAAGAAREPGQPAELKRELGP